MNKTEQWFFAAGLFLLLAAAGVLVSHYPIDARLSNLLYAKIPR
jgi:hypothetical protein